MTENGKFTDHTNFVTFLEEDIQNGPSAPSMRECFDKHLPTKNGHNYLPLYERHFEKKRFDVKRVVEIGVEAGTSLRLWKDYFPNAEIIGFDIDPACKIHEEDRIQVIIGDQTSTADLDRIPGNADIIIDDGWHTIKSQLFCFEYLVRQKLAETGIYVVEDVIGSDAVFDYFNKLSKFLNYWPKGLHGGKWSSLDDFDEYLKNDSKFSDDEKYYIKNILGVSIYRHLIFIDKGKNPQHGQAALRLYENETWAKVGKVRQEFLDSTDFDLNKHGVVSANPETPTRFRRLLTRLNLFQRT